MENSFFFFFFLKISLLEMLIAFGNEHLKRTALSREDSAKMDDWMLSDLDQVVA